MQTVNEYVPKLFMMVGLPGSGKSTYADYIITDHGKPIIHSSDKLREELYNDINNQDNNSELFQELHKRIKEDLRNKKDVVYDATNISKKRRISFLNELKNIPCIRICILIMTPIEDCIEFDLKRKRTVSENVIYRMLKNWNPPYYDEGFDNIILITNTNKEDTSRWSLVTLFEGDCGIDNFNQENKHHSLTLGKHCRKTADYILKNDPNNLPLQMAALLHDIGKIITKSKLNTKGEVDGDFHYYQHHCVGAYESIFYAKHFGFSEEEILYISNLIFFHMHPYLSWKQSKNAENKQRIQLGEKMYNDIILLHEADVKAH